MEDASETRDMICHFLTKNSTSLFKDNYNFLISQLLQKFTHFKHNFCLLLNKDKISTKIKNVSKEKKSKFH